jgi:hypothetical protein
MGSFRIQGFLHDGHENINRDGDPDLSFDCILGSARSAQSRSNGLISHETAPVTERFEVNRVAITEKLINMRR